MQNKIKNILVKDLDLPGRVKNVLIRTNINTVADLEQCSIYQLLFLPCFGRIAVRQIAAVMKSFGIELQPGSLEFSREYIDFWKQRGIEY